LPVVYPLLFYPLLFAFASLIIAFSETTGPTSSRSALMAQYLTKRQRQFVDYIQEFTQSHGYAPSFW
jgi:hypothetical protein